MPCILCKRGIAALPLPICARCREERDARNARIDCRPKYNPRPQTEAPETD